MISIESILLWDCKIDTNKLLWSIAEDKISFFFLHKLCFFGHLCPFRGQFGAIFQAFVLMPSIWFYSNVDLTSKMYQMCAKSKFPKQITLKNFQNIMKNDNFCHLGLFLDPVQPRDNLYWISSAMKLYNKSRSVVLVNCWR